VTAAAIQPAEQKQTAPPLKHAHCTLCQKGPGEVIALCGQRKRVGLPTPIPAGRNLIPAHACVVCADLLLKPCQLCGGSAW
jgi:hypothetical protein